MPEPLTPKSSEAKPSETKSETKSSEAKSSEGKSSEGKSSEAKSSEAESTSESEPQPEQRPEDIANETGEPVFFDGTITKLDSEGRSVMSDHIAPGETLARTTAEENARAAAERRTGEAENKK